VDTYSEGETLLNIRIFLITKSLLFIFQRVELPLPHQ